MTTEISTDKLTEEEIQSAKVILARLNKPLNRELIVPPAIELLFKETGESMTLNPLEIEIFKEILELVAQGKAVSISSFNNILSTREAADILGCSRPHIVKILDKGEIPFTNIGKHRRIEIEELLAYKRKMKSHQRDRLIEMMEEDENSGLYDQ